MQISQQTSYGSARATAALRVLAVNSIFPNEHQPYYGIFNALALQSLTNFAKVSVVSPVKWCPGLAWALRSERKLTQIPESADYNGLPVTYPRFFRTPGFGRRWHGWFYRASIEKHLKEIVAEFKPDVLLASWAHPDGYAVQQIGESLRLPVAIKCLGSDIHQLFNDRTRSAQVIEALKRCDRVIAVSNCLRDMIISNGVPAHRVITVYNGVDHKHFHPTSRALARKNLNLSEQGRLITCVASLVPIKRHRDLLQAFRMVRMKHMVDAQLAIVGEGPLRDELKRLARKLQIENHVIFAGSCTHDQVPMWMAASNAVALASENEGLPNVLVEALACGRPVVATRVGGIPELVHSHAYGRLVDVGAPEKFAEALVHVLDKTWDPYALSACPEVISWEDSALRLFDVLDSMRTQKFSN